MAIPALEALASRVLLAGTVPACLGDIAGSRTIYVSPLGKTTNDGSEASPWPSASYALAKAGGGITIIFKPGTYAPILIRRGQGGTSTSPTVIKSEQKWKAVINGSLNRSIDAVVSEYGATDYVVIDGLKVIYSAFDGIELGGNSSTAKNNWIRASRLNGIAAYNRSHTTISNNLVESNGTSARHDHGVYASGYENVISGNIVRNNSGYGIHLSGGPISGSSVVGNLVYGHNSQANIVFDGAVECSNTMKGNYLFQSKNWGIVIYGANPYKSWVGNTVNSALVVSTLLNSLRSSSVSEYISRLSAVLPPPPTSLDTSAPMGSVIRGGTLSGKQTVTIRYKDNRAIDVSSVGAKDVMITGSNNYSSLATVTSFMLQTDSRTIDTTYVLSPPLNGWKAGATYRVYLRSTQIRDVSGNYAKPTFIGSFLVAA